MKLRAQVVWSVISICLVAWFGGASLSSAQGTPPSWINIYGTVITTAGQPVPVGTLVEAITPSGGVCGAFTVATAGKYGFLPCRIRDASTPNGVVGGDVVSFRVGGQPVLATLSLPTVISMGDRFSVDLLVGPGPTDIPEPFTVILFGAGLVGLAGYIRHGRAAQRKTL